MPPSAGCCSVEVLQLKPVLEEDVTDEPPSRNGEATLVEGHE
jgi:hypothetical protein